MAIVIPLAATPFVPGRMGTGWASPYADAKAGRLDHALANYGTGWTGVDLRAIQDGRGLEFCLPTYPVMLIIGTVIHKVAGALGVNRYLARAKVPFIRV